MPQKTMNAVRVHEFGSPEELRYEQVALPEPGSGEVLIRVVAAAANPPDWYAREGMPGVPKELVPGLTLPLALGTDASGVVEAVGDGVDGFSVGDEVFGMLRFPSSVQSAAYAEYVTAPVSDIARKPVGVSHQEAAGASMAGLTAWQYLIDLGHDHPSPFQAEQHQPIALTEGMTVLINGAAGGVGHLVVQLAKWKGARVIAVASGAHEAFLRDLGADEVIDYTQTRPEDVARDVDLVVDMIGGPDSRRLLRTLKPGGALFYVYLAEFDPEEVKRLGVTVSATQVRANGQQLEQIGQLIETGTLRVAIDSTYPLADARKAHERAAQGHLRGKIVLDVSRPER
jgi:NADPH:quinone reductase-like Zn-dependent oxidoreductase